MSTAVRQAAGLLAHFSRFGFNNTGCASAFGNHCGFLTSSRDAECTPASSSLDSTWIDKFVNSQARKHGLPASLSGCGATRNPLLSTPASSLSSSPASGQTAAMLTGAATRPDAEWMSVTLPALLNALTEKHLGMEVVKSIIQIKEERERKDTELERKDTELERKDTELERKDKELQAKCHSLHLTVLDYLKAQGKFDARGLYEHAQRVLAVSKEANMAQDGSIKWTEIFNSNHALLQKIQRKLAPKKVSANVAATMATNAYSLTSGAIHSGRFIQPDVDYIVIYEGILPRDLMLLSECIAQEVGAPYKTVYAQENTKGMV